MGLLLTMEDLYPNPSWGFCYGWASFTEGVGGYSLKRFHPDFDGVEVDDPEKFLLEEGCAILVHELGHQFGFRHCIYYECLMNGVMSADEKRRGGIKPLCPVCHRKLQQNLKFDSKARFEALIAVCDEYGFEEEAAVYRKIIKDAEASGI